MIQIKAIFKDNTIIKTFNDLYDAIEYRDNIDAHYPINVEWIKLD